MRSLLGALGGRGVPDRLPMTTARGGASASRGGGDGPTMTTIDATATQATLFAIVDVISTAVSKAEWKLYARTKSGDPEDRGDPITNHAAWLVWNKPNPFFTGQDFRALVQKHRELTGEGWPVLRRLGKVPAELWAPRPDRMRPVKDADEYLLGYIYTSPDGEEVPLERDDVLPMLRHNPADPYRGLGVVQSLLTDLDSAKLAALWNRNFFRNSAEPGGIVELDTHLNDDEWIEFTSRWRSQHQGVSNAHRVAVLERGATWRDRSYSMRDMQFTELRRLTRDMLLEGFGLNKFMIGASDDVNRAASLAAEDDFNRRLVVPRLDNWQAMANDLFLTQFAGGEQLEFVYTSPVQPDTESDNAERASKTAAFKTLIEAGVDPDDAARIVDLPPMTMREVITAIGPAPATDPAAGGELGPMDRATVVQKLYLGVGPLLTWEEARAEAAKAGIEVDLALPDPKESTTTPEPAPQVDPETVPPPAETPPGATDPQPPLDTGPQPQPEGEAPPVADSVRVDGGRPRAVDPEGDSEAWDYDLSHVQDAWVAALDRLLADWTTHLDDHIRDLVAQVRAAVADGDLGALGALSLDTTDDAETLLDAMHTLSEDAAEQVRLEAETQGATIEAHPPTRKDLKAAAAITVALLAAELALSAGREAARVWPLGTDTADTADDVADTVKTFLDGLTDARPREALGGALTTAQNEGRIQTFERARPEAALYANEVMDSATCKYCREIHGRWIGNAKDAETTVEVRKLYPGAGYVNCLGRERCRGTITGVWRPQTTGDGT